MQQGYVEAGTKTSVSVIANAWDERAGSDSGGPGCGESGCLPELAHDGIGEEDIESRWSCSNDIVPDGGKCKIEFTFGSPQDIVDVEVDFWKGDERTRTLEVCMCDESCKLRHVYNQIYRRTRFDVHLLFEKLSVSREVAVDVGRGQLRHVRG